VKQESSGLRREPTVEVALRSLQQSIASLTEYATVSYCGLFETYIQCWALNFLLAELENGKGWTVEERALAQKFSPLVSTHLPSFYDVCALPIEQTLRTVPHVFVNPRTGRIRRRASHWKPECIPDGLILARLEEPACAQFRDCE
jgi:hypothetical protein